MAVLKASGPPSANSRICVIGAGPCGLTAVKNLRAVGLCDVVCYDDGEEIGGNWVYDQRRHRVSVYECTHIISSRHLSGFDDFPMPEHYPDFPSHRQILAYFHDYATKFGVRQHVRLRSKVVKAERTLGGRWIVSVKDPTASPDGEYTETFDYLMVCAGHHRDPYVPDYPGQFTGARLHSSSYRRPDRLRGQNVLVVGGGNSACDIAVDVSRFASATCISMRHGAQIAPKLMFGHPIDVVVAFIRRFIPTPILQPILRLALRGAVGPWEAYGLQRPTHGPLEMHPTLNGSVLEALRSGRVQARVGIERFEHRLVRFCDGREETFDTIIWATGFRTSFPFLSPAIVDWLPTETPHLYLKMMHRSLPTIFFIGLFQPVGCIWNLADYQARIVAQQILGKLTRPADIVQRLQKELSRPHWRYSKSPRHSIEVDALYFRKELLRELSHVCR